MLASLQVVQAASLLQCYWQWMTPQNIAKQKGGKQMIYVKDQRRSERALGETLKGVVNKADLEEPNVRSVRTRA